MQLIIDDGVPSRGHRENIFKPNFSKIGIYTGTHKVYNYMTCMDFQSEDISSTNHYHNNNGNHMTNNSTHQNDSQGLEEKLN